MLLSFFGILLITTALGGANQQNNRVTTLSSPQRKLLNTKYAPKENQISDSTSARVINSEVAKANGLIIKQEHNLLGVIMFIVTKLMEINSLTLSDLDWEILSRLFASAMSVIFGPNTNIVWPEFAHLAIPFLKLLTT